MFRHRLLQFNFQFFSLIFQSASTNNVKKYEITKNRNRDTINTFIKIVIDTTKFVRQKTLTTKTHCENIHIDNEQQNIATKKKIV